MSPRVDSEARLLLIGVGPHSTRFYLPTLMKLQRAGRVMLTGVVELESERDRVHAHLKGLNLDVDEIYVRPFGDQVPDEVAVALDQHIRFRNVTGVIIATDPLNHLSYALWSMSRGVHTLLDKPITSRRDLVSSREACLTLRHDYQLLKAAWTEANDHREVALNICTHRRYHPGIHYMISRVGEVCQATGCPVTSARGYHSDGQWRFPAEVIDQSHHSYHDGHGKLSHSGYHFFDTLARLIQASQERSRCRFTSMDTRSTFIKPRGFLKQIGRDQYLKLFGDSYLSTERYTPHQLWERFEGYGELDGELSFTFKSDGEPVSLMSLGLLHGGFSRRSWVEPNADLYKGNGRVKHEQHIVHVGPFLSLQLHSYQAKDKHEYSDQSDYAPGGNNHFEVYEFRNSDLIGGPPIRRLGLQELGEFDASSLLIEQIKSGAVLEFIELLSGERSLRDVASCISQHELSVKMMSAAYLANLGDGPFTDQLIESSHA